MNSKEARKFRRLGLERERQMREMRTRKAWWLQSNPGRVVLIQFNYNPNQEVIGAISDAVEQHYVSTNEAGLELIKALWPWDDRREPTVAMVRTIIEGQ